MTKAGAYQAMADAADLLLAYGTPVLTFRGLEGDRGEIEIQRAGGVIVLPVVIRDEPARSLADRILAEIAP